MDSQFQSLKEELQDMCNKNYELRDDHASKNDMNDDTSMCERLEANYIRSEDYQNQDSYNSFSRQSHHDPNDSEKSLTELKNDVKNDLEEFKRCIRSMRTVHWKLFARDDGKTTGVLPNKESKTVNQDPQAETDLEKSITKFLNGQRVTNMFFKNNANDMILKMKQNEKNFQTKIKNMERKIDEWSKSQNVSLEQTERTDPPPPQAHTEQVNAVFTESGKSDDHLKIQKDPPPPIIVNNKIEKDRPFKTSKGYLEIITGGALIGGLHFTLGDLYNWSIILHVIESLKSSTHHSSVNEFVVINIPEEDVEPKQIILDPDDQPMWESAKTVAPTPNSAIIQLDVDDNFVINSTHLKMILENKFDGYLRADPPDYIHEFLAICDMFKYGKTQSEAVKLLIFPFSLCDEAKTWFNELNEESITSWEQMRRAFINRFFPPSLFNRLLLEIRSFSQNVCESLVDAWLRLKSMLRKCHRHGLSKGAIIQIFNHGLFEPTQGILDITAGGIFLYKSPNQAFQFLKDKLREGNASKIHLNDDTPMCEHHEVNYIEYEGYQIQNSYDSFSHQSIHDPNDSEKSLTELNDDVRNDLQHFKSYIRSMRTVHDKLFARDDGKTTGVLPKKKSKPIKQEPQSKTDFEKLMTKFLDDQRVSNIFVKNNVTDMILMMKQNKNNFQTKIKDMKRKLDEWEKSQNISSEQIDRTDPPPPQTQTEHVNVVFTGSGKFDYSPKILKDPPPPIIINNKIKKDKPIKTSKRGYQVVKTNVYPFRKYIPKTPYSQRLNVNHSHLNRIVKVS
ncbi:reverse transcriptase domain-containing protein [Tanacetum coccineum]